MNLKDQIIKLRESIQYVSDISGISIDKTSIGMLKAHEEFEYNLKKIGLEYTPEIDTMLVYFRIQYEQRPHSYIGDKEFYSLLWRCLMKGLSIGNALSDSKNIIDREMALLDAHYAMAKPYCVNLF